MTKTPHENEGLSLIYMRLLYFQFCSFESSEQRRILVPVAFSGDEYRKVPVIPGGQLVMT